MEKMVESKETLSDVLRDSCRPVFLFGAVPPKEGTTIEKAKEICSKFVARGSVLATDGFIIYDIQDEASRTTIERPFPFRQCMDASIYASFFPAVSGKQCVVYKSVVEAGVADFDNWMDKACDKYNHNAFNLVGAPSSRMNFTGLALHEAGAKMKSRGNCGFGCVCIPERHTKKGDEHVNMVRKVEFGAEWFITQGVFSAAPVSKMLNEYGDLCREKGMKPKKVVLTFAPCGRRKTMTFIKWLGMYVPEHKEKRIFDAESPVKESVILLKEILSNILEQTSNSGVPLGINVESLSIYKDEIDAAHDLFQALQAILLNSKGSPWAIRWFPVAESNLYTSAKASHGSLSTLELLTLKKNFGLFQNLQTESQELTKIDKRKEPENDRDPDLAIHLMTVGFVGLLGIAVGRYSHQQ